ncbi:unnamed protein product [Rotaria socialis]|uniref:Uncharacterized protein n=1 Tax=Rotaria socialis TaxID=392032 RepID=A0A821B8G3_9BILA|nr:unnamed protein product [Rotaria socialis]
MLIVIGFPRKAPQSSWQYSKEEELHVHFKSFVESFAFYNKSLLLRASKYSDFNAGLVISFSFKVDVNPEISILPNDDIGCVVDGSLSLVDFEEVIDDFVDGCLSFEFEEVIDDFVDGCLSFEFECVFDDDIKCGSSFKVIVDDNVAFFYNLNY